MSLIRLLFRSIPITLGGIALLGFGLFLLSDYYSLQFDLVANMIGGIILGTVTISILWNLYLGLKLRKRISISASFTGPGLSSADNELFFKLDGASLPVLFKLKITPVFDHNDLMAASHLITGRPEVPGASRYLIDHSVRFKHRGIWNLTSALYTLTDVFGIGRFSWAQPMVLELNVSASDLPTSPVPIVASSYREGDLIQAYDRSGEPYDLKPYDPSEGVRRVVWKIYAKTGELITRRAEPSHIPDGEVCVYLCAGRDEDHVAGALQNFLVELVNADTGFIFGSDGLKESDFQDLFRITTRDLVRATDATKTVINGLAWSADAGYGNGVSTFFTQLDSVNKTVSEIVLFGSTSTNWIDRIRKQLPPTVKGTYILVPDPASERQQILAPKSTNEETLIYLEVQPQL